MTATLNAPTCPRCRLTVIPTADGACPSCRVYRFTGAAEEARKPGIGKADLEALSRSIEEAASKRRTRLAVMVLLAGAVSVYIAMAIGVDVYLGPVVVLLFAVVKHLMPRS